MLTEDPLMVLTVPMAASKFPGSATVVHRIALKFLLPPLTAVVNNMVALFQALQASKIYGARLYQKIPLQQIHLEL